MDIIDRKEYIPEIVSRLISPNICGYLPKIRKVDQKALETSAIIFFLTVFAKVSPAVQSSCKESYISGIDRMQSWGVQA